MTHDSRTDLLRGTLPHVAFDGWSDRALKSGAADVGISQEAARALFPDGGAEMIELHSHLLDNEMERRLVAEVTSGMRVRDRVGYAVKVRLALAAEDREAVRRAVTYLAMPSHSALSVRILYRTVDMIWRCAGDKATDWNFYSKRGLLSGVYASAVLFMLQDGSPDCADTAEFVDRRIADVMRLPKVVDRLRRPFGLLSRKVRPQAPRL